MPITVGHDTAKTRKTLTVGDKTYAYYSIAAAESRGAGRFLPLPAALKVVLENMLRFEDGKTVTSTTSRRSPTGPRRAARTRARSPIARRAC
jgi:aconitate hydratase